MTAAPPQPSRSQTPPDGSARWLTPAGVLLKRWPDSDNGVVYDARHARTHLLAAAACEVLERCTLQPSSVAMLAEQLEADDGELILATVTALEVAGLLLRDAQPAAVAA